MGEVPLYPRRHVRMEPREGPAAGPEVLGLDPLPGAIAGETRASLSEAGLSQYWGGPTALRRVSYTVPTRPPCAFPTTPLALGGSPNSALGGRFLMGEVPLYSSGASRGGIVC